ncbi:purine-binding chemotaxis protein CheW [Andreprevotia lacus DSM 23236]|jgi:purine-binding chemotaxis protein CheW|uniref:Purine-binding chemotaxis protein CheW n=1 Tax=Andreprevotia lacus DSM 23236 TaxID=1121001 RepID=A0A1W1X2Y5_9NEIS|nr:chemotaxis protein CheW [Andreprevotia lacus]SMC18130.1 purine-binding chemotaxis protein CheW [Andreprevotia lacus DSM 23236]
MSNLPATAASSRLQGAEQPGTQQFLTFTLSSELFAIPIEHIREIIEFGGLTEIPMLPPFLRGVINLRGAVVPVVDLAARFGRNVTEIGRRTCIVILEVEQENQMLALGIIVDAVNEVLSVEPGQIEPRPSFGAKIRADFIDGMISLGERFVIALDIQQVLSVDEMATLIGMNTNEELAAAPA